MMLPIIDTNNDCTRKVAALKQAGIVCVIRYISVNTAGEKCIKPAEAHAIAGAGLMLGLVFEVWGGSDNFSHNDINAQTGEAHGSFAKQWAANVGAPAGTIIWFAIDTDTSARQIATYVLPYFKAIRSALSPEFGMRSYRVGIYGPGAACAAMLEAGYVDATWLSNAMGWSGSRAFRDSGKWTLLQHPETSYLGLSVDPNENSNGDYGSFVPWGIGPITPISRESGKASWYETLTANGEAFDPNALTGAHRTLAFGTMVKVSRLDNHTSVTVRINDRGPFVPGRVIDLTPAAAKMLNMIEIGIADVVLEPVPLARLAAPIPQPAARGIEMSARLTWWLTFALVAVQGLTSIAWATLGLEPFAIAAIAQAAGYVTLLLTFAIHGTVPGIKSVRMPSKKEE